VVCGVRFAAFADLDLSV
jgi:hypothetical protein